MRALLLAALMGLAAGLAAEKGQLYQYGNIEALSMGGMEGAQTVAGLLAQGDTGLGTYNGLDGEMVVVDGAAYRVDRDGTVTRALGSLKTPFASVWVQEAETRVQFENVDQVQIQASIDQMAGGKNGFYGVRVDGVFASVRARSVARQQPPYPSLVEALKTQAFFDARGVQGTLVGLRTPDWARGVASTGFHFHFISADRSFGGHMVECLLGRGEARIVRMGRALMETPNGAAVDKVLMQFTPAK